MASARRPRKKNSLIWQPDFAEHLDKLYELASVFRTCFGLDKEQMEKIEREFRIIAESIKKLHSKTDTFWKVGVIGSCGATALALAPLTSGASLAFAGFVGVAAVGTRLSSTAFRDDEIAKSETDSDSDADASMTDKVTKGVLLAAGFGEVELLLAPFTISLAVAAGVAGAAAAGVACVAGVLGLAFRANEIAKVKADAKA